MSFSKFPEFQKLTINDIDAYLPYFKQLDAPYCDFSVDDMYVWTDYNRDLEVSELYGNLILRYTSVLDKDALYHCIVGISDLENTFKRLRSYFTAANITPVVHYVPEHTARLLEHTQLPYVQIEEDEDNRDYVYHVPTLLGLQGKPYENLRRRINHFKRANENIEVKELNLKDTSDKQAALDAITKWSYQEKEWQNDPDSWEQTVIEQHLALADHLPVRAFGLYVDGILANINIVHFPPHSGWLIFNHIKCDYSYQDIYGYAFYSLFQVADSLGIEWIDFEQDLGLEGLRRIKHLFRPAKFLKRYTVSLESDARNQ